MVLFPWRRPSSKSPGPESARTQERALRLRRLFDETQGLAWRVLRRFGVREDRLEDSFQQLYLIASTKLDDIRPGSERAFVYGIAIRLARSSRREAWREIPEDAIEAHPSPHVTADMLVDQRRLVELCDRVLEALKPDLRETFVLYEIEGLTGVEIAELLEIPEGTVHSRLRRARAQVRALVQASRETKEVGRG